MNYQKPQKFRRKDIDNCEQFSSFIKDIIDDMHKDYLSRADRIKDPEYGLGDIITFKFDGNSKTGYVYVLDAYGTFEQDEEPSYDVMVEEENCLYKHVRESLIIDGVHKETVDSIDESVNNNEKEGDKEE